MEFALGVGQNWQEDVSASCEHSQRWGYLGPACTWLALLPDIMVKLIIPVCYHMKTYNHPCPESHFINVKFVVFSGNWVNPA